MIPIGNGVTHALLGSRDPILEEVLRRSAGERGLPTLQIDDSGARILQLITMISSPLKVVEVGTLFGYSAIHIGRALKPGARLVSLEIDPIAAAISRENIEIAGLSDVIDVLEISADEYLSKLDKDSVDMFFIDADKKSYPLYLKLAFPALRVGGLIIADDALAVGDFSVENDQDSTAAREIKAIETYVRAVSRSPFLYSALAGTENGLLISYRTS